MARTYFGCRGRSCGCECHYDGVDDINLLGKGVGRGYELSGCRVRRGREGEKQGTKNSDRMHLVGFIVTGTTPVQASRLRSGTLVRMVKKVVECRVGSLAKVRKMKTGGDVVYTKN